MTYEDRRLELLIAAVVGAVLGGFTGIVLGYGPGYTVSGHLLAQLLSASWFIGFEVLGCCDLRRHSNAALTQINVPIVVW